MNAWQIERLVTMRQEDLRSEGHPFTSGRRSPSAMHSAGDVLGRFGAQAGSALVRVGTRLVEANDRPQRDLQAPAPAPAPAVSSCSCSC